MKKLSVLAILMSVLITITAGAVDWGPGISSGLVEEGDSFSAPLPESLFNNEPQVMYSYEREYSGMEFSARTKILHQTAYVMLVGGISDIYLDDYIRDFTLIKQKCIMNVVFNMQSGGGDLPTGLALADMIVDLKRGGVKVTMVATGIIASAAVPIYAVGTKRIAYKSTIFLIHPAALFRFGFSKDDESSLESQHTYLSLSKQLYLDIMSEHTGLKEAEIAGMMGKDTYFLVGEAVKYGLVDEVR